jgi:hypothetical protein
MAMKEIARRVIDTLSEDATLDEIMHALYVSAKFRHGEEEIRQGKGIEHEEAKRRLGRWVK